MASSWVADPHWLASVAAVAVVRGLPPRLVVTVIDQWEERPGSRAPQTLRCYSANLG